MNILDVFLTIYLIYIPVFLIVLLVLLRNNPAYSIRTKTVSELAFLDRPWSQIFDLLTFFYGLLGLFAVVKFITVNNVSPYVFICLISLAMVCLGTILEALFPLNVNKTRHFGATVILFFWLIITEITFSFSFLISESYIWISLLSGFMLFMTLILLYKARRHVKTLGNYNNSPEYCQWEWALILTTFAWNFLFTLTLLVKY